MRIFVLGGAGKMGCISVQSLANDDRVDEIILADINVDQAKTVADYLDSPKIRIQSMDVNDEESFVKALDGADACLNATVYYTNLQVMEACLKTGVPYTDMGGLFHGTREQLKLHDRFAAAGVSAVLCMGSAPGVPNIQTRYAADRLDTIESIKIYDGIKPPPPQDLRFSYAVPTILDEITVSPMVFENGRCHTQRRTIRRYYHGMRDLFLGGKQADQAQSGDDRRTDLERFDHADWWCQGETHRRQTRQSENRDFSSRQYARF